MNSADQTTQFLYISSFTIENALFIVSPLAGRNLMGSAQIG